MLRRIGLIYQRVFFFGFGSREMHLPQGKTLDPVVVPFFEGVVFVVRGVLSAPAGAVVGHHLERELPGRYIHRLLGRRHL
jgi:hypothetical protein